MPRETPSPIDLPAFPLEEGGRRWTSAAIAVAALFLLATNAVSLRDWIEELSPGPAQARAAAAADWWGAATDAAGVGRPRAWLHDLWKRAEGARFGA